MIGAMPPSISARTLRLTFSLVSPNIVRRSEWPTMQYSQPISLSIATEISPV